MRRRSRERVGDHTFRATGVTAYLKNGGPLERAVQIANHANTRTTQLYDRRAEEKVERGHPNSQKMNASNCGLVPSTVHCVKSFI